MELYNDRCEVVFPTIKDESIHAVITDPPYNISEEQVIGSSPKLTGLVGRRDIQRDMGEWDKGFSPAYLINQAARVLYPGGWFAAFCSDRIFPYYKILLSADKRFRYKATIVWEKTNPVPQVRQKIFLSTVEYIALAIKVTEEKETPIAWNWLGQRNMKNIFKGPLCSWPERLYWHEIDGVIVPCSGPGCKSCAIYGLDSKITHPAQKPMYAWRWLYSRLLDLGMTTLDPYAGTFSSSRAAFLSGYNSIAIEADPTFFKVGNMWLAGEWNRDVLINPLFGISEKDRNAQFEIEPINMEEPCQ